MGASPSHSSRVQVPDLFGGREVQVVFPSQAASNPDFKFLRFELADGKPAAVGRSENGDRVIRVPRGRALAISFDFRVHAGTGPVFEFTTPLWAIDGQKVRRFVYQARRTRIPTTEDHRILGNLWLTGALAE